MIVLEYWRRQGHEVAGEQYIADSGFLRGGTGRNNRVADGVEFRPETPRPRRSMAWSPCKSCETAGTRWSATGWCLA
jgi:hypothetical protein